MSAGEIAELTGKTRQAVDKYAKKNNWPFEEDTGQARGGKLKKYLIAALPPEVQAAIREKQAATLLAKVPVLSAEVKKPLRQNKKMRQLGLIPCEEGLARLDDRQTETAHARCAIVAHVLPLHELAGMPIKKAVAFVVAEAAAGRLPEDVSRLIPLANARNNGERGLSEPTLYRWVRAYRAAPDSMSRLLALAPVKTREKTPLLAIDWLPYFLMFYQRPNKPTMMAAAKKLAQWYLEQGKIEQMPSYDQIQTVMKRLPDHMTVYRELIERQLAVRQAGLQIGLQKANEQEPFIAAVAETLSRTMWGYAMRMDARFEVTFVVNLGYPA